jgi:hypothetical protein
MPEGVDVSRLSRLGRRAHAASMIPRRVATGPSSFAHHDHFGADDWRNNRWMIIPNASPEQINATVLNWSPET